MARTFFVNLLEAVPGSAKTVEGLAYEWAIVRQDGIPVDTAAVADQIQVTKLPNGGLELKLIGLQKSAAGLEARCRVRNATAEHLSWIWSTGGNSRVIFNERGRGKPTPNYYDISKWQSISSEYKIELLKFAHYLMCHRAARELSAICLCECF